MISSQIVAILLFSMLHVQTGVVGDVDDVDEDNQIPTEADEDADNVPGVDITTLRLVQALFRHGDRSPTKKYENDKYQESDWPQGFGQLSTTGMLQEYRLGQYFREEYVESGFMSARYSRWQIQVRSTDYDRTLMSAQSVLAGLFPPEDKQVWKEGIPWQPIPVHTTLIPEDYLLHPGNECPKYSEYVDANYNPSQLMTDTVNNNKDLYEYMSENAGEPATWLGMQNILDPIFCQYVSGYELPDWVMVNVTLDKLLALRDIYASSPPQEVAYLRGGPLVGEMLKNMRNISVTPDSQQKMFLYSAHDTTVVALLQTLNVFNMRVPSYTACVIVELHELMPGDFYVQMFYKNETDPDSQPYSLKLNYCDTLCPLEKFAQIMNSSIPIDIKKACGIEELVPASQAAVQKGLFISFAVIMLSFMWKQRKTTVAIVVLSSLIILMLSIGGVLCFLKRNNIRDTHNYSPVPLEMT